MKRRIRQVAVGLALTGALAVTSIALAPDATAKIQPVDISCENGGGNLPGGQQPSCQGQGLDQNSENQNPAGHAPPGQN
jgi:hypothetical protein